MFSACILTTSLFGAIDCTGTDSLPDSKVKTNNRNIQQKTPKLQKPTDRG